MHTPDTITPDTATPFTVVRDLIAYDEFQNRDIVLPAVRITVERIDREGESYEFITDWSVHLRDDDRFRHLPADTLDCAESSAVNALDYIALLIYSGESVPAVCTAEAWHYKPGRN